MPLRWLRQLVCHHQLPPIEYPLLPGFAAARCRKCRKVVRYRDIPLRERR